MKPAPEAGPEPSPAEDGAREELRRLVAAARTYLQWLGAGGVEGVPMPARPTPRRAPAPTRPEPPMPPIDRRPVTQPMEGRAGPPAPSSERRPPMPVSERPPLPEPPSDDAPPFLAEAATAPRPPAPRPVPRSAAPALVRYPELPDPLPSTGAEGLRVIRDVIGNCQRCKLCHGRSELVFGQGDPAPLIAFVGEGPGAEEDRTGLAFVGAAGDLLTQMINAMSKRARELGAPAVAERLHRDRVYICNVVKCRPPGNRTPEPEEMAACGPFLRAQLQALRPKIIVALGRTPSQFLLSTSAPISKLRGQLKSWEGIPVMPTFHPAYLLRTPSAKRQAWDDLQAVLAELQRLQG